MRMKGMCSEVVVVVAAIISVVVGMVAPTVMSAHYMVGDSQGWTVPTKLNKLNYSAWANSISFQQGDFLEFKYGNWSESVMKVVRSDYHYCDNSDPVATFHDGNTVIELSKAGYHYFIASLTHHCEAGQKLMLEVPFSSPPTSQMPMVPALAPSPSPPLSPEARPQAVAGAAAPLAILLAIPFVSSLAAILLVFL